MTIDWYPAIRECCAYWSDADMLQQTFQALDKSFTEENDACIDGAKCIIEVICRLILDELDDPTHPAKPSGETPSFSELVSATTIVLKLGGNPDLIFRKLVSQHYKLTDVLGSLRNVAGPVSHGRDAFLDRLSSHHRRAAVLSADAIVAFMHQAYIESDINFVRTRQPYERLERFNVLIDKSVSLNAEIDDGDLIVIVSLPDGNDIPIAISASKFLYQMDREAYIEALNAARSAAIVIEGEPV